MKQAQHSKCSIIPVPCYCFLTFAITVSNIRSVIFQNGVSSRTLEVMPSSASQLEVPSAEYLRTPSLSYSSSPATHLNSLSPVCMTSPTTDYSTSSTAVYSMTRPSGYTCTLSPTSAPLDIVDTNPLYGNTRHSSNITHPFQSPLPAACNSSDSVHSDKVEHPMDLSINCPKPSALSTCQLPRSASLRIQQISSLFNTFREDYYQIITVSLLSYHCYKLPCCKYQPYRLGSWVKQSLNSF